MKKYLLMLFCIGFLFAGCNHQSETPENQPEDFIEAEVTFDACVFDEDEDKIILTNSEKNYTFIIYLYGNKLEQGEYSVLGSDQETELEGIINKGTSERDVKTTLLINHTQESFKATGTAELYKENDIQKSGETFNFTFNGTLQKN